MGCRPNFALMKYRLPCTVLALILGASAVAVAQDALSFKELAEKMDPYFVPELVQDVKDALPQSPFDVWGYDVGDFSGDGVYDFAMTIRMKNDTKKKITVYFFIDDEGILKLIRQSSVNFVELPIEVGVSISNGNAYIARRETPTHWGIEGYRYSNGVVMMVNEFDTDQQGLLTHEEYRNYQTLEGNERYRNTNNGEQVFQSEFMTVPSYGRGRDVSSGYQSTASARMSKYVLSGSYFWAGNSDFYFDARSAFDDEYLYFNVVVHDDDVIPMGLKETDTVADRLEIWMDMYTLGNRLRVGKRSRDFRTKTDSNIYAFNISLGDLYDKPADVKVSTSNDLDQQQTAAAKKVRAIATRLDGGYSVKTRIPWALLGFNQAPIDDSTLTEFGMTLVAHDVDNVYRPEETTTMTTSKGFEPAKPATFGGLTLVPRDHYYGEAMNIYLGEVKERLEEVGF